MASVSSEIKRLELLRRTALPLQLTAAVILGQVLIFLVLAGGLGFEPRQTESESVGLPLADPPMRREWPLQ